MSTKIVEVAVTRVTGAIERRRWPAADRQAQMADIYPDANRSDWARSRTEGRTEVERLYVEIRTNDGPSGLFGPVDEDQAWIVRRALAPALRGADALATEAPADRMMRMHRHGRSGLFMTAVSAIDCALWDLKGKCFGVPVWRLLGGPTREKVPAYASMLGHSVDPERAARVAEETREAGYTAQKWFFRHGPGDGGEGMRRNVALVAAVRDALGPDYPLMVDAFMSWDLPYALEMVRRLAPYGLTWLEEPLPPERVGQFAKLRSQSAVPLATGEHVYTRWQVEELLAAGAVDYIQTDPDWCGGVSELVKICVLCSAAGVPVVAHGHSLLAALHVAASQSPATVPYVEYLIQHQHEHQALQSPSYHPRNGALDLPELPGLGIVLDESAITSRERWEP